MKKPIEARIIELHEEIQIKKAFLVRLSNKLKIYENRLARMVERQKRRETAKQPTAQPLG